MKTEHMSLPQIFSYFESLLILLAACGAQVEHAACRYRLYHHIQTPKAFYVSRIKSHR